MKTLLSSGLLGCLSLALFACGGDDSLDDGPADTGAANATDTAANDDTNDIPESAATEREETPPAPTVEPSGATPTNTEGQIDPILEAAPVLAWRSCGTFDDRNLECAEVEVPVDYDQPDGDKLPIAMRRIVANPLEPYHGSLLINPGGPGGRGIDFALQGLQGGFFDAIAPGYDIIGFDPRGVGDSGERGCGIRPQELYPAAAAAAAPTDGLEAFAASLAEAGAQCESEWGPLFRELGSNNVVRDMDAIRKALGEAKLNFFGGSYGTRLGSLYAHMFPATTGRVVLDAVVQPRSSWVEGIRDGFYEITRLHEQVFTDCEAGVLACPPDSRILFEQILTTAREGGFEDALSGYWRAGLEAPGGPQALVAALQQQAVDPGGTWLQATVTSGGGDSDDGGAGTVALFSVNCTDDVLEPPTLAQVESLFTEFSAVNPLYASDAAFALLCSAWPATRDPVPLPTAPDVDEPLLVIGGLNDWRTPYSGAVAMTEALGKATLLTSDHYGHGATGRNDCVTYRVRAYLTSGSLPAAGTLCQ